MSATFDQQQPISQGANLGECEQTFTDAARVLAVRRQIDDLSLAVLAGDGLGGPAVGQLQRLLGSRRYAEACSAYRRLGERG